MQTGSPNIQTARIICAALMSGVVLFWVVAFVITAGQGLGAQLPLDATVLLAIVIAVAVGAFGIALSMRSKATSSTLGDSQAADASTVLTKLIMAWALLEGQAFLAGTLFMLSGNVSLLIVPALVFVAGFAMTFPKAEWFAKSSQTARP